MSFRKQVLLLCLIAVSTRCGLGLSTSHFVRFPLINDFTPQHHRSIIDAFDHIVDSTNFFEKTSNEGECSVPVMGEQVLVSFTPRTDSEEGLPTEYELKVDGVSQEDFRWICTKFYESVGTFTGIKTGMLRRIMSDHMNARPPHPGYDAELTAGGEKVKALFESMEKGAGQRSVLETLEQDGIVVIDSTIKTTEAANEKMSEFLSRSVTTGQGPSVRRDKVAFLDFDDAASCGVNEQYDVLMGIASYLNRNLKFAASSFRPVAPGTKEKPLTNPRHIQAAEYNENDFYVSHSDNSLAAVGVRSNLRCYTCILYCNDDWRAEDGGALRIYRKSSNLLTPSDARECCSHVDIIPLNGRLLIFDSKLVHSVEKVQAKKARRALTLWILRPEDNGARGEVYYFGEDDGH